jgi:hypothetical protein
VWPKRREAATLPAAAAARFSHSVQCVEANQKGKLTSLFHGNGPPAEKINVPPDFFSF